MSSVSKAKRARQLKSSAKIDDAELRMDGWENMTTLLGTREDKSKRTRFGRRSRKSDQELEALFDYDDMAYRIVTAGPEAMLRGGFAVDLDTPEQTTALHEDFERLHVVEQLLEALIFENTYGGSAIFIGADDGGPDLKQPLNLDTITSVRFLKLVDCRDLQPAEYYSDALEQNFGQPSIYRMGSTNTTAHKPAPVEYVHESRFIFFRGGRCSTTLRREHNGWGQSKIDRAYSALQTFANNWASVEHLMTDASQAVYMIKGLIAAMSTPQRGIMMERMRQVDRSRSNARALALDADRESMDRKDTNMSGLPDLLDRTAQRLAAAIPMPVSILLGRESGGLNPTGEMDVRTWYAALAADQKHQLAPKIRRLAIVCMAAKQGPTKGVRSKKLDVIFEPIWQPTPSEQASLELQHAQTDQIRITSQMFQPAEVATARFRPEGYQNSYTIDTAHYEDEVAALKLAASSGEELPPSPVVPDDSPEALGSGVAPRAVP